jgi:hypothetical protein
MVSRALQRRLHITEKEFAFFLNALDGNPIFEKSFVKAIVVVINRPI